MFPVCRPSDTTSFAADHHHIGKTLKHEINSGTTALAPTKSAYLCVSGASLEDRQVRLPKISSTDYRIEVVAISRDCLDIVDGVVYQYQSSGTEMKR